MKCVHYSNEFDFSLDPARCAQGLDDFGPGIFVYPEDKKLIWNDRTEHLFECPENVPEFVQSFEPGEAGNENEIAEFFIPATKFDRLKQIY